MKKLLIIMLSLILGIGVVACNKKETVEEEKNTVSDEVNYDEKYSVLYNDYLAKLRNYSMYDETDATIQYYKDNEYPGNENYLQLVKDTYNDIKVNIQSYIDGITNDVNTKDEELSALNKKAVTEGEKTIANIDKRLEKLDSMSKDAYEKSQDDFIRLVNDSAKLEGETKSEFNTVVEEINKKLGIDIRNNDGLNK